MTAASWVGLASSSKAAFPQMPTKNAASPPTREMNRARTTRRTSLSAHIGETVTSRCDGPPYTSDDEGGPVLSIRRPIPPAIRSLILFLSHPPL